MKKILTILITILLGTNVVSAQVVFPARGGTGIGTIPTYGQMLVGNSSGTYTLTATSSLGITGSGGGSGTISTSTNPTVGLLAYWTSLSTIGSIATSSLNLLTTHVTEGSNLYWTNSRFDTRLAASSSISGITTLPNLSLPIGQVTGTIDISGRTNLTAGDALTLTDDDIDFDGGATPSGDLGGSWATPSVTDDSHAHTGSTISGVDISSDTNLAVTYPILLTGDTLSSAWGTTTANIWNNTNTFASSQLTVTGLSNGCLQIASNLLTSTGSACGSGSGGGTDGNWVYFNGSGIRLATTTNQVVIGATATTTTDALEVTGNIRNTGELKVATDGWDGGSGNLNPFSIEDGLDYLNGGNRLLNLTGSSTAPGVFFTARRYGYEASAGYAFGTVGQSDQWDLLMPYGSDDLKLTNVHPSGPGGAPIVVASSTNTILLNGDPFYPGNVGIGTTSPYVKLSVNGSGVFNDNVRTSYITATSTTATSTFKGGVDLRTATVQQHVYRSFAYSTSTSFTGTTTLPLGPSYTIETWSGVKCFTDTGTLNVSFNDSTNRMNLFNASTTVGTVGLVTNNTFTVSEKRYVDVGTPVSSPTKISCTVDVILNI